MKKLEYYFEYYKQSILDLKNVPSFNLPKEMVEAVKKDFGVDITEKVVEDFAKTYKFKVIGIKKLGD